MIYSTSKSTVALSGDNLIVGVAFCILYILNPLFSIALISLVLIHKNGYDVFSLRLLIFFIIIYLSLINTTKIPDNDLEVYLSWRDAAKYLDFYEYTTHRHKEPIYFALDYMLYYLFDGEPKPYIFAVSFITYGFILVSVLKICNAFHLNQDKTVLMLVCLSFFPQLFSLTAHIIRQCLAGSVVLFFFANRMQKQTTVDWLYYCTSILLHSTALIFVVLMQLINIKRLFSISSYKSSMLIIVLGILFLSLVTIFVGVDFLLYPMDRVTSRDSRFSTELGSFSIQQVIFAGIAIAISGYYYFEINKVPLLTNVKEGLGITLALSVITLSINFAFGAGDYSELAFRYFFYVYFFVPFPLGILLSKIKWDKNFTLFTMLLTSAYFFYSFENSAWKYASIETIILSPIFYYF